MLTIRTARTAVATTCWCAALTGCAVVNPTGGAHTSMPVHSSTTLATPSVTTSGIPTGPGKISPYPTGSGTGAPRGFAAGVKAAQGVDAGSVAAVFVTMTYAQDTRIDTSPYDAQRRAAALATPAYAAQLIAQAPAAAPGAQWNTWAQHRAYTTVKVSAVVTQDQPPPTPTVTYLTFAVRVSVVGVTEPAQQLTAFVKVTRVLESSNWQVASMSISTTTSSRGVRSR